MHGRAERRYRRATRRRAFAAVAGAPFSRLEHAADPAATVLASLCPGRPRQGVVAALGPDGRTAAARRARAHLVRQGRGAPGQVRADEPRAKLVGRTVWRALALALAVPGRPWPGGALGPRRGGALMRRPVGRVRARARRLDPLVCVDGPCGHVTAVRRGFRAAVRAGRRGRPRPALPDGSLPGQVVERYARRRVTGVVQRAKHGTASAIAAVLAATRSGRAINTAYIGRLNATFRGRLGPLVRRGRAIARTESRLTAGMWLVGGAYNVCWYHAGLRREGAPGGRRRWQERTPAMAAGLTDHRWTLAELPHYRVPLPCWGAPRRRGRPPTASAPLPRTVPQPPRLAAAA